MFIDYEEFKKNFKEKNYKDLNFSLKKIQKYYAYYAISKNNNIDNPTLKKNFKKLTNINVNLTNSMLYHIRTNIFDIYKNCNLDELISKKFFIEIKDFQYYMVDFNYEYKEKNNKLVNRNQRVYIFGIQNNFNLIKETETNEFFLDIIFKIIPKNIRPYKLIVISGIPIKYENPILICFILVKFMDEISYEKIFNYLYENFKFNPSIIHTDFEKSLLLAIKNNKFFENIIHTKCHFHFSQMLRRRLSKIGLCKKK